MKEPPHGAEVRMIHAMTLATQDSAGPEQLPPISNDLHRILQVFVGGVPRGATEEQIKEYASKVGPVSFNLFRFLVPLAPVKADKLYHSLALFRYTPVLWSRSLVALVRTEGKSSW